MTIPFAIIWAAIKAQAGPLLGIVGGWVFGDWRRIVAVIVLIALVTSGVVIDRHRASVDKAYWQAKINAQANANRQAVADANKALADANAQLTQKGLQIDALLKQIDAAAGARPDAAATGLSAGGVQSLNRVR